MATVWKIGSRWSSYGAANASILSIFRRNKVVFVGLEDESWFLENVHRGDYFAIADGYQIVAIAKATSFPDYIGNLKDIIVKEQDNSVFNLEENKNWAVGVKVQIHDIRKEDWSRFYYMKRASICRVNYELSSSLVDYYENDALPFAISSRTCSLTDGGNPNYSALLNPHITYIVPVYQRPYEWSEDNIRPFVTDILNGYLGKERNAAHPEPLFIGTMQLAQPWHISKTEIQQDIIDGQQRITTLTIFLNELKRLHPEAKALAKLGFNWIETHVSKEQGYYLDSYLSGKPAEEQNQYYANARLISDIFLNEIGNLEKEINIERFCDYLLHSLYFVVIETTAGVSKTIQIFNTINNSGLDLNGSDLFKVRMYEYLTDCKGEDESAFEKIQAVYQLLDKKNRECGKNVTGFDGILDVYKNVLVTKFNLNSMFYAFGWDTFFERLFDTLLGIKTWDNFGPVLSNKEFEISLDEIAVVIETRFEFESYNYQSVETRFAVYQSTWWSRYSRSVWLIIYQFLYFYRKDENKYSSLETLLICLNKLFFIYSVTFYKQIYEINSFVSDLIKSIAKSNPEEIIKTVKDKIASYDRESLKETLGGYITNNDKRKRLVCSLSTYLEERYDNPDGVWENIFGTAFDIEHIHANADELVQIDETLQNSIGNLGQLEYDINRSIQAIPFSQKRLRYKDSKYLTFKHIAKNFEKWDQEEAENRRKNEVDRMLKYIYDE